MAFYISTSGRMVEWFKAAVLKTAEGQLSEGSNPTPSAIFLPKKMANEDVSLLFTLLCQQKLFTQNRRFSSHLHQTPEALLVKTLHFISLVKRSAYAAREVAA